MRTSTAKSNPKTQANLLEALGGDDALQELIEEFMDRASADEGLSKFFRGTSKSFIQEHQFVFLKKQLQVAARLGNDLDEDTLKEQAAYLAKSHRILFEKGANEKHFDLFVQHFREALSLELELGDVEKELLVDIVFGPFRIVFEERAREVRGKQAYLLARLGEETFEKAVDEMFCRVINCGILGPIFQKHHVPVDKLKEHQRRFFMIAFTGYDAAGTKDLMALLERKHAVVNKKIGLTGTHFDIMVLHFTAVLEQLHIHEEVIHEVVHTVEPFRAVFCKDTLAFAWGAGPGFQANTGHGEEKSEKEESPPPSKRSSEGNRRRHRLTTRARSPTRESTHRDGKRREGRKSRKDPSGTRKKRNSRTREERKGKRGNPNTHRRSEGSPNTHRRPEGSPTHRKSEGSPSRRSRVELSRSPSRRKTVAGSQPNRPKRPIASKRSKSMGDNLPPFHQDNNGKKEENDVEERIGNLGARCATIADSLRSNMQQKDKSSGGESDDGKEKRVVSFDDTSSKLKQQFYCGALTSINSKPEEGAERVPMDPTAEKIAGDDKKETYADAFASLGSMRDLKVEDAEDCVLVKKECKDEETGKSALYSGALSNLLTGSGREHLEDFIALDPGTRKTMSRDERPIASSSSSEGDSSGSGEGSEDESESYDDSTASPMYTNHIKNLCGTTSSKSGLIERYSAAAALLQKMDSSKSLLSSPFPVPPAVTVDHAAILSSLAIGHL